MKKYTYLGAVDDSDARLQRTSYQYDANNRMVSFKVFASAGVATITNQQYYFYDDMNRVSTIKDKDLNRIIEYKYLDRGPLEQVILGGVSQTSGTKNSIFLSYSWYDKKKSRLLVFLRVKIVFETIFRL